jgi:hypothetical protein
MQNARGWVRHSFLYWLLLLTTFAAAQNATVSRSSNLRQAPNTDSAVLKDLNQGDTLTLTSNQTRVGYYHARTSDGTLGWIWARNVRIGPAAPPSNAGIPAVPPPSPGNLGQALTAQLAAAVVPPIPKALIVNGQSVCAAMGKPSKALNSNKNRVDIPHANAYIPVDWTALAQLPANQSTKLPGAPVMVQGFLSHQVKVEAGESTNCGLTNPNEVDWHMYLTHQPHQPISQAIVVETTPRTRPLHSWDKAKLDSLVDSTTEVRISGWLMYDTEHVSAVGTQRATVWEVHPITRIETRQTDGSWKDTEH